MDFYTKQRIVYLTKFVTAISFVWLFNTLLAFATMAVLLGLLSLFTWTWYADFEVIIMMVKIASIVGVVGMIFMLTIDWRGFIDVVDNY